MAEGEAMTIDDVVAALVALPPPDAPPSPTPEGELAAEA